MVGYEVRNYEQPGDWHAERDLSAHRYGDFRRCGAHHDRHAYGYVIIIVVLFLGTNDLRKGARGVDRPGLFRPASDVCILLGLSGVLLFVIIAGSPAVIAQDTPPNPPPRSDLPGQVVLNPAGPCVQPPPMVQLQDYDGPFHKVIGTFTQKLDRLSVHDPHYRSGTVLCSLEMKDKLF